MEVVFENVYTEESVVVNCDTGYCGKGDCYCCTDH